MENLWSDEKSLEYKSDLALRVYTSNLLGQNDALVLHGGGNTSVKSRIDGEDVLYVKGSGWDLVSIKEEGFAPVKLATLLKMAKLEQLSDTDMVSGQKAAMLDKEAPNTSVEAILHALIPYKFVDHTHADAVVTISNSENGVEHIQKVFPNFLIVPYVMPGFLLAQTIERMTQGLDWESIGGIILHHHGIFTFDESAKKSYEKMIAAVTLAEEFLEKEAPLDVGHAYIESKCDIKRIVAFMSKEKGYDVALSINQSPLALFYSSQENLKAFASRGVLTPEHIIRTKRTPLVVEAENLEEATREYKEEYMRYFDTFATDEVCLNPSPNYMIIKNSGVICFGKTSKEASIINDIVTHTMMAVLRADKLGGYKSISLQERFEMEYWELEQAKLKR